MRQLGTAVLLVACGCGGDDSGGSGVATACGTEKLVTEGFGGSFEMAGTVTFPEPLSASHLVQIVVTTVGTPEIGFGNILDYTTLAAGASSVTYAVTELDPDDYYVYVAADVTGDQKVGEGDWIGFYGGTVAAPAQYTNQQPITISTENACGRDWGIGPLVCKASYGEACTTDSDCRGTVAVCEGGVQSHHDTGSCQGTCMELTAVGCGTSPALSTREGSCYGSS